MAAVEQVKRAKELSKYSILSKPNVVGVGYGYKDKGGQHTDELCVVALVRVKLPKSSLKADELIPATFDGVSTDVVQVGDIRALQERTDRWRPAPGGVRHRPLSNHRRHPWSRRAGCSHRTEADPL